MTRGDILALVVQEREAQAAAGRDRFDVTHTPNDWIAILARHVGLAASDEARVDRERYRRQLVRLAAVALAALEQDERRVAGAQIKGAGW